MLIVEDDHDTRYALVKYFERKGYAIRSADNAKDVLDIVEKFIPDLLITDWKLNDDIDGADIAKMIAKKYSKTIIIMITGHQVEQLKEKVSNINVYKIIRKPFEFAAIKNAVDSAAI